MAGPTDPRRPGAYHRDDVPPDRPQAERPKTRSIPPGLPPSLAREIDEATRLLIADLLMESERRFALRLETEVAAQKSAELLQAERTAAEAQATAKAARADQAAAEKRATTRGALAIGSSSTTVIVLGIVGLIYRAISGMYSDAVAAVQIHSEATEEVRGRTDTNAARIDALETADAAQAKAMTKLQGTVEDTLTAIEAVASQLEHPKRKPK